MVSLTQPDPDRTPHDHDNDGDPSPVRPTAFQRVTTRTGVHAAIILYLKKCQHSLHLRPTVPCFYTYN